MHRPWLTAVCLGCALLLLAAEVVEAGQRNRSRRRSGGQADVSVAQSGTGRTRIARVPDLIELTPGTPAQVVGWTPAQRARRVHFLTNQFISAAAPESGRWQIIEFVGVPFRFSMLRPHERTALEAEHGFDAAQRYNRAMAMLVEDVIARIDTRSPEALLSVVGLPIEEDDDGADAVRLANDTYRSVIERLDALTTARSFIRMTNQDNPTARVAAALPEAHRLRAERPVLYRMNRVWHVSELVFDDDDDTADAAADDDAVAEAPAVDDPAPVHVTYPPAFALAEPSGDPAPLPPDPGAAAREARAAAVAQAEAEAKAAAQRARAEERRAAREARQREKEAAEAADGDDETGERPGRAKARVRVDDNNRLVRARGRRNTTGRYADCNENDVNDLEDIRSGHSEDCNENGVPDECETLVDADGDGTPDCRDDCPRDPNKTAPGVCGCGTPDVDTDGDGTPDCHDECPNDPAKVLAGTCGCGVPETDRDGDGTPDCADECPDDPYKSAAGECGCGVPESVECSGGAELIPGHGFDAAPHQPEAIGADDAPGRDAPVVARWDVVPYQTVRGAFDLGVVAFHVNGIDRVAISVAGGPWADITTMTVNPRTGVREYWGRFDANDLRDGAIEVRAVAYPTIGTPTVLPPLTLYANAGGTLPSETLHVSGEGSDRGGDGSADFPFRTIGRALAEIELAPELLDGAEIVIETAGAFDIVGDHRVENERWITVRAADGLHRDDVILSADGWLLMRPNTRRLRFRNVSIDFSRTMQVYKEDDAWHWYDDCRWYQSQGRGHAVPPYLSPVRNVGRNGLYATSCVAREMLNGFVECNLTRNCTVEAISGDCFRNSLCVLNAHADDVDGAALPFRTDVLQYDGAHENVIVYGVTARNVRASANLVLDGFESSFANCAFVNIAIENRDATPMTSTLRAAQSNLLFAHLAMPGQRLQFDDGADGPARYAATTCRLVNSVFRDVHRAGGRGAPRGVAIASCHFIDGEALGDAPSTGDVHFARGANGVLQLSGPAARRLVGTAAPIPGLVTDAARGAAPDRAPWPVLAGVHDE